MTDFSFTAADLLYLATLSLGGALNFWFFTNQYLECRARSSAILLIDTLFTLAAVLLYSRVPVLFRSIAVPAGTFLLVLVLYRGSFLRKLEIVAAYHICILFLDLLVVASMATWNVSYAAWSESRLFQWVCNVVIINLFLIPAALLLRPVLRARKACDSQETRDLTCILAALFAAVTIMIGFVILSISSERNRLLLGISAAAGLLVAAVLLLFWLFRRIELLSRREAEQKLLELEYRLALERREQAGRYRTEIREMGKRMADELERLSRLIRDGKTGDAVAALERIIPRVQGVRRPAIHSNPLVDYLLAGLEKRCGPEKIRLQTEIDLPRDTGIDDVDFCTVLSNLMDNAVDAARAAEAGNRFIRLSLHKNGGVLYFGCENSKARASRPERRKRRFGHFGLANIRETAAKYGGDVQIEDGEREFSVRAILYCPAGRT